MGDALTRAQEVDRRKDAQIGRYAKVAPRASPRAQNATLAVLAGQKLIAHSMAERVATETWLKTRWGWS